MMIPKKQTGGEPPRFKIEEDDGSQGSGKILPLEQRRVIEKLLRMSGHGLESDEHEIMLKLIQKLTEDAGRIRALQHVTGGGRPLDTALRRSNVVGAAVQSAPRQSSGNASIHSHAAHTASSNHDEPPETPKTAEVHHEHHVVGFRPEEVVQRYIECWNKQMFGAEFDCFSRSFLSMDRNDYIARRQQMYRHELGDGGLVQRFGELLSVNTSGYESEVTCSKLTRKGQGPERSEQELYRLRIEDGHWVIYHVRPLE